MSKKPPLLPTEALRRTLRTARFDGGSVLFLSGLFALAAASGQDGPGTIIGLIAAGAGAVELHGSQLVQNGDLRGMRWLIASQLYLLAAILGYTAWKLQHVDLSLWRIVWEHLGADQKRQQLAAAGLSEEDYLQAMYSTCYHLVALLTIPYQGGMALYYLRRRQPVTAALSQG
jgi:hypothetical protein